MRKELTQQKFNNAHNLSIDQSVADEIMKLNEIIMIQGEAIDYFKIEYSRLHDLLKEGYQFYDDKSEECIAKFAEVEKIKGGIR